MADTPLQSVREMAGLSLAQLDRAAGLATGTTHDLESGRTQNPSWQTVGRIVRALQRRGLKGVTAESIFPISDASGTTEEGGQLHG